MGMIPEGDIICRFPGMGMGVEVLLQFAPLLLQHLSSVEPGRPNPAFSGLGSTVCVEVGSGAGSTARTQQRNSGQLPPA